MKSCLSILFFLLHFNTFSAAVVKTDEDRDIASVAYFIDSKKGKDTDLGTDENSAWRSFKNLEKTSLHPGYEIRFKRGSEFSGTLTIRDSGDLDRPIVLTAYGDMASPAPSFTNSIFNPETNQFGNCIRLKGCFIIVENLYFHDTVADLDEDAGSFLTIWELGAIYIDKNAENCLVRNNEIYNCGVGIKSYGSHAKIENNYIHDCNRVLKNWGWGPIAIWLGADNQEVSYNRIINYSAVNPNISWGPNSYGGGADGGAIEIDDARSPKSNISIHHNFSQRCQGFLEVTWTDVDQNPDYRDFKIHHNISDDYQQFVAIWRGANFSIDNNTIIRRRINVNDWGVFNFTQFDAKNLIRNNIVIVEGNVRIFNVGRNNTAEPSSIISNNLYFAHSDSLNLGYEGPGHNPVFGDPHFVNYSDGTPEGFAIGLESMAIGKGLNIGYNADFIGTDVPQSTDPDIGAYEYISN